MIVDDYAHHPSEIAATIASVRSGWNRNLIVVFQPHLYSRTRDFYKEFAQTLAEADKVILAEIYPAREEPIGGVNSNLIVNEAQKHGYQNIQYIPNMDEIETYLLRNIKSGDMIITMGAGDIWMVSQKMPLFSDS